MVHVCVVLQAEYWIDVARQVNDDSAIFDIDVGNQIVNLLVPPLEPFKCVSGELVGHKIARKIPRAAERVRVLVGPPPI